jgi:hypothetical protein
MYEDYEFDDMHDEYECKSCSGKENVLCQAKEFLESIVGMLYSKKPLDINEFEWQLEELCHYLNVKMGDEIQIQRKEQKSIIVPLIQEWQTFNNQYLTQLTQ